MAPTTATIPIGGNQAFSITFSPRSTGNKTASAHISHNAVGNTTQVSLAAVGSSALLLSESVLDFGRVDFGKASRIDIWAKNIGGEELVVDSIYSSLADFRVVPRGGFTVAPADSVRVRVFYSSDSLGVRLGTLTIALSDQAAPMVIVELKAISIPPVPEAGFSATPVLGDQPLDVAFTDQSLGLVSAYLWDFGDGESSTVQNPTHTYAARGIYTVRLTVTSGR